MVNILTPKTISEYNVENFILNKLIENGNDLYRDIFDNDNTNEIDKNKFKESINFSLNEKTPNFSISNCKEIEIDCDKENPNDNYDNDNYDINNYDN
jgi:hypothetical protein